MNRRRFLTAGGGVLALGAAGLVSYSAASEPGGEAETTVTATPTSLPTTTVTRGTLGTEREFRASVSFGDPWALTTTVSGTVTASHEIGTVIGFGEFLIRVDDRPLTLARGTMPLYRELHEVDTRGRDQNGNRLTLQDGLDVAQLQTFLLEAGHTADEELEADGVFGPTTEQAVKAWQEDVGHPVSGRVDTGQLVFSAAPLRLAAQPRVGDLFSTLEVSRADAQVIVDTSNRDRTALGIGTEVEIELPDSDPVLGTVTEQEQATGADGSRIWRTTVEAAGQLPGTTSAATVKVVDIVAEDVLLVPVTALLAVAEGGFAVELAGARSGLVRVEVGEVLDGRAEVSGDIEEGTEVVIPV